MALNHALLPEFDQEIAHTRRSLERVPGGKFGWKPHEKSMTMGQLVLHIATIPGWVNATLDQDSLDMAPPGEPAWEPPKANSTKEILEIFDKGVAAARAALAAASDDRLTKPWSLLSGGKTILTSPRIAVLRSFIMNHAIRTGPSSASTCG